MTDVERLLKGEQGTATIPNIAASVTDIPALMSCESRGLLNLADDLCLKSSQLLNGEHMKSNGGHPNINGEHVKSNNEHPNQGSIDIHVQDSCAGCVCVDDNAKDISSMQNALSEANTLVREKTLLCCDLKERIEHLEMALEDNRCERQTHGSDKIEGLSWPAVRQPETSAESHARDPQVSLNMPCRKQTDFLTTGSAISAGKAPWIMPDAMLSGGLSVSEMGGFAIYGLIIYGFVIYGFVVYGFLVYRFVFYGFLVNGFVIYGIIVC